MFHDLAERGNQWSIGQITITLVMIFVGLHILQWSARCGPFATGKYRDYCTDIDQLRVVKSPVLVNETTIARNRAIQRTPYVDLKDNGEVLEEFVPPGWGRSKNNANVREGPGMDYEVIDSLIRDSIVEIIEEQDGWIKVRISAPGDAEQFGWVWRDLLAR